MILIFEQDTRSCRGVSFVWVPELFISDLDSKKTWRFCWGWWSLSCYGSEGLKDFMDYIADGKVRWFHD